MAKKKETKKSVEFEQLNARIHSLIEGNGATVVWDGKVPDPDSPADLRQIDVLITTADGRRIAVECRERGTAQSVMWIEELAGRRDSLKLDAMIAVSLNSFSALAVTKAARFGIVLYDFNTLSDAEISSWTNAAEVRTQFLQFSSLVITAILPRGSTATMSQTPAFTKLPHDGYHAVMATIRDNLGPGALPAAGNFQIQTDGFEVEGVAPVALLAEYIVDVVETSATCTSVMMRDHPEKPAKLRDVSVERFDHSVRELITHNGDLHLTIDVDKIISPDNSILDRIEVKCPAAIELKKYELVGDRRLTSNLDTVELLVCEMS